MNGSVIMRTKRSSTLSSPPGNQESTARTNIAISSTHKAYLRKISRKYANPGNYLSSESFEGEIGKSVIVLRLAVIVYGNRAGRHNKSSLGCHLKIASDNVHRAKQEVY